MSIHRRVLFVGGCRTGKTTLVNTILNGSASLSDLGHPGVVGSPGVQEGTTSRVAAYCTRNGVYIDSIGITDPRFTLEETASAIHEVLYHQSIGISRLVLVMRADTVTEVEWKLVELAVELFGDDIFTNALLVVTHYRGSGDFVDQKHNQKYADLLAKFPRKHVVAGDMHHLPAIPSVDKDHFEPKRRDFLTRVEKELKEDLPPLMARTRGMRDIGSFLRRLLWPSRARDEVDRVLKAFSGERRDD
eukprot:Sspe_Gene.96511::Locus_69309_Transcript_1_1_Confidence_1.000_Length_919::g.96511::m.96511